MITTVRHITPTNTAAAELAGLERDNVLRHQAKKLNRRSKEQKALQRSWSEVSTPPSWCQESSADLMSGINCCEVPADTIPGELRDELF